MMNLRTSHLTNKIPPALLLVLWVSQAVAIDNSDAIPITVSEVLSASVAPLVPAAGTVFSRNQTQITAGLAGRLEWVAEPGDQINAGESVARFDCEMLDLQRERQVAEAQRADINFRTLSREVERMDTLTETNAISIMQYERTQADRDLAAGDLTIARITIRETEKQLRLCNVKAPFSGVVTEQMRRAGEDVERSTVLAAMTDTQDLEVRASVPIRYLPRMQIGEVAEVKMNKLRLEGRIRKIVPAANSQSQTFEVRLELPKEDGAFVMRINSEQIAERVSVEVTESNGDDVAVRGNLESGDRVAVRGAESLQDGELVAVQSET
jgi:RND family efflux transporter MFP subunit